MASGMSSGLCVTKYTPTPFEGEKRELTVECKPSGTIDPNQIPVFTFSEPVTPPDSSAVHFKIKVDSLFEDAPFRFEAVEGNPRQFRLYADWALESAYSLELDSAAVKSVYGRTNKPIKQDFRTRKEEEYGTLFIKIMSKDSNVVVQLLNTSDKPVRTEAV